MVEDKNIGEGSKGGSGPNAEMIAGIAVAAVIAGLAFFLIKKRRMIPTSDIGIMETNNDAITLGNDLNDIMNEDDPFQDFVNFDKKKKKLLDLCMIIWVMDHYMIILWIKKIKNTQYLN